MANRGSLSPVTTISMGTHPAPSGTYRPAGSYYSPFLRHFFVLKVEKKKRIWKVEISPD
jgi:hypothetical protein